VLLNLWILGLMATTKKNWGQEEQDFGECSKGISI
jgi:hypothetical protein